MKTIILAGGYGTRLGNITEAIPKPMVKIGNYPILWHILKIYDHYGYNDFIFSLGYKAEVIKQYFFSHQIFNNDFSIDLGTGKIEIHNRYHELNWKVTLVDTGLDALKGARIKRLESYLDDVNMVTYGDGVCDIDINKLVEFHKSHGKILTISGVHPPARFGAMIEKDGRVVSFEEKTKASEGYINGGYMVFNRELLNYLTEDESCDFEIGPMDELVAAGEVMVYKHDGNWECLDTERDLVHLNRLWKNDRAFWKVWKDKA